MKNDKITITQKEFEDIYNIEEPTPEPVIPEPEKESEKEESVLDEQEQERDDIYLEDYKEEPIE